MENKEIRSKLHENGIKQWELARGVGVHESTLTCWLREPLQGERAERVRSALEHLLAGRE